MKINLGFQVEVPDVPATDPEALVDATEGFLVDRGVTVLAKHQSAVDNPYTVFGVVKGKPDEKWSDVVYAVDEDDAEKKARKKAPKGTERTVAVVLPGDQITRPDEPTP